MGPTFKDDIWRCLFLISYWTQMVVWPTELTRIPLGIIISNTWLPWPSFISNNLCGASKWVWSPNDITIGIWCIWIVFPATMPIKGRSTHFMSNGLCCCCHDFSASKWIWSPNDITIGIWCIWIVFPAAVPFFITVSQLFDLWTPLIWTPRPPLNISRWIRRNRFDNYILTFWVLWVI